MAFSTVTIEQAAQYLRIDFDSMTSAEQTELSEILNSAREFIRAQTGLSDALLDTHDDFVIALYCVCQHQYDNRGFVIEKTSLNPLVQTILATHSINFL